MKRIIFFSVAILCVWAGLDVLRSMSRSRPVQAAVVQQATNTEYRTPTFIPTRTPIPTPTIGYEMTLQIAQATADEARRINAQVTAEHESYLLSQMQLTAGAEMRNQEILSWTAQAGPTVIPLTATMQQTINTQIAQGQAIQIGQLTATKEAPTQISAMARSQAAVKFADASHTADIVGKWVLIAFVFALSVFIVTRWRMPNLVPVQSAPQKETVIQLRNNTGAGTYQQVRLVVPCSPEQLTELAEMAVNGEKKFGINKLETQSRTFKSQRETILAVRQFLIDNHLVITDANGMITLNADGETFLFGWFDAHKLPDTFEFGDATTSPPLPSHDHDTHAHDEKHGDLTRGGGEIPDGGAQHYTQEEGVL